MVSLAAASYSPLIKNEMKFFPKGILPQTNHCNEWMPGLFPKNKVRGITGKVKDSIYQNLKKLAEKMQHLASKNGRLIRLLGAVHIYLIRGLIYNSWIQTAH